MNRHTLGDVLLGPGSNVHGVQVCLLRCLVTRDVITLPKLNLAPEKLPSQQESSLPTTIFQGLC